MEEVYPVGNTHKAYYDDVLDYFEDEGFASEGSHILVVGGELIAWNIKNRYPKSEVESIDVSERTMDIQSDIAERLASGEEPSRIVEEIDNKQIGGIGDDWGTVYPGIVEEVGEDVLEPDVSRVQDVETYEGNADMIISNNVGDYAFGLMDTVERVDPDYVELYTLHPAEQTTSGYSGRLEPDVNPDVDFWWAPGGRDENMDVILYTEAE